ncbi:MAG: transposase [Bacteroidetes bacterium]|nr:transposase [Bacteroidota bacterium]
MERKVILDFVRAATENHRPIKAMLMRIKERGFKVVGFLVVIDGSKGIHKAVSEIISKTSDHSTLRMAQIQKRDQLSS